MENTILLIKSLKIIFRTTPSLTPISYISVILYKIATFGAAKIDTNKKISKE